MTHAEAMLLTDPRAIFDRIVELKVLHSITVGPSIVADEIEELLERFASIRGESIEDVLHERQLKSKPEGP